MRVTVCEISPGMHGFEHEFELLKAHLADNPSDLVVLPEMAFHPWLFGAKDFDRPAWDDAVQQSEQWLGRLAELGVAVVSSRPTERAGKRRNEGYVWSADLGYVWGHDKHHLPNFGNTWEAEWYEPGDPSFSSVAVAGTRVGWLICSEIWVNDHCYDYARQGVQIIVNPRATEVATREKWQVAVRMAGIVGGAFACSSSHYDEADHLRMGGGAWVADPYGKILVDVTYPERFATVEVDLELAVQARRFYPRNMVNGSRSA